MELFTKITQFYKDTYQSYADWIWSFDMPAWLENFLVSAPGIIMQIGISLLFLCLLFRPLEAAFPAKKQQRFLRPEWWTDLIFFLGQYIIWTGAVLWVLYHGVAPGLNHLIAWFDNSVGSLTSTIAWLPLNYINIRLF